MIGYGLLALLGVGVAMSMGGGDDDVDIQQNVDTPEDDGFVAPQDGDGSGSVADFAFDALQNAEPDDVARIEAYMAALEEDPSDELLQEFQDFINSLGIQQEDPFPDSGDEDTDNEDEPSEEDDGLVTEDDSETAEEPQSDGRPPMGAEYRDPLIVAEEAEQERIEDEIAAEEARQPENLVTVTGSDGEEVDDDAVMTETGEEGEPAYSVVAPAGENSIEVGFDAEHTFAIEYNKETTQVTAGLNSTITGPDGGLVRSITNEEDENGVNVRTLYWEKEYSNETDITIEVSQDHIGAQIARIDLTNPHDTLHFDFAGDVTGELHIVYLDDEDSSSSGSMVEKRAYIIHTGAGAGAPSASDIASLLEAGGSINDVNILAEVYLGEDTVDINGDPDDGKPYEVWIHNFINDNPNITSNIEWASESAFDDMPAEGGTDEPVEGDGEDDIAGLFVDLGLNPGFFGF